jgi:hypothetical protein
VKTLCISDSEINERSSEKVHDLRIDFDLSAGFLNKLRSSINLAWEQIHSRGEKGLVFILVRFDDPFLNNYGRYRKQLTEFCRSQDYVDLVIKGGHLGNKIIRM